MKKSFDILINQNKDNFTKKELEIVKYLKKNIQHPELLTIKNIINSCNIGFSVVYKFLNKIELKSFRELLVILQEENYNQKIIDNNLDSSDDYLSLIKKSYNNIINKNASLIDANQLDVFIEIILKSNVIYIMGAGESQIAAKELSNKLTRFGIKSFVINSESGEMLIHSSVMTKNDLLITISMSGRTTSIVDAAKVAKQNDVFVACIVESNNSPLEDVCDLRIQLVSSTFGDDDDTLISPLLSTIFFTDVLLSRIMSINTDKFIEIRQKTSEFISKYTKKNG